MVRPSLLTTMADFAWPRAKKPLWPGSVRHCPDGSGPVLVIPGLLGTDSQTRQFRDCLQMLGYKPFGWEQGANFGPAPGVLERIGARIVALSLELGPVDIVGFGMGGVFARWAAESRTHHVRRVVTVNTPFREPHETAWRAPRMVVRPGGSLDTRAFSFMIRQPPRQPWLALYSRNDRVVQWSSCMDPAYPANCIEITARHATCMRDEPAFREVAGWLGGKAQDDRSVIDPG